MKILMAALITMLVVLQYDLWIGDGSMTAAWRLDDTITEQKKENAQLQLRNETLAAEVNDLKSGTAAIEERARSELGMIKKDETFVQIIEDRSQSER